MTDIWKALQAHHRKIRDRKIVDLFDDPARFQDFSATLADMLLDYSKTNLDAAGRKLLLRLAAETGVETRRDEMFAGRPINSTENRAVLHTALRAQTDDPILVDGQDVLPEIRETRARMAHFAEAIRAGRIRTAQGGKFTDVVNIGIGGSDLGPVMVTRALAPYHDGPRVHFISNIDGAHIADILGPLDPAQTLVIIASKTFTTVETMTNARTAVNWLSAALGERAPSHLAAVSSAVERTSELGIDPSRVFGFADWVGGRYSVWGPVGLPVMLAVGADDFATFLQGGAAMDEHFRSAPPEQNLPLLLGLVGIWHNNICGHGTRAILPYDQRLEFLPTYLQQLDMESNGKSVTHDGTPVARNTGPVVWGAPGTNGQHAFFQLLHQGTQVVPAEFMIAAKGHEPDLAHQHDLLIANCLAQSEALMRGRSSEQARKLVKASGLKGKQAAILAQHRSFAGNRPSITLTYEKLTPFTLGRIIALYEHRVFVEGTIWGINSFDQWGVELGKEMATALLPAIKGVDGAQQPRDGSTRGLLAALKGRTTKR
ncbi:MAG: glucose-6-phosphate isomerase [Paracoccaceae bacterium]|nr:glucose-6-phosphate isomerase [Paracoccaceae bacterium]